MTAMHCTACGQPSEFGDHQICDKRRELEPPRFCAQCARRMVVQVTPMSWRAVCSEHGTTTNAAE
jgi:hypothetical protein